MLPGDHRGREAIDSVSSRRLLPHDAIPRFSLASMRRPACASALTRLAIESIGDPFYHEMSPLEAQTTVRSYFPDDRSAALHSGVFASNALAPGSSAQVN